MDQLLKLPTSSSSSGIPSVSVAQSGKNPNAFSCYSNAASWIKDSGSSNHMTNFADLFSTYTPYSAHEKIRIADGSLSPVAG